MKKTLVILMAMCGLAIAAYAQTKTTIGTNAKSTFENAKTWDWVTGAYHGTPIAYDKTKGAIVEVTFKELSPAQKFRVNVQSSGGNTDFVDMTANAAVGSVVRVKLDKAENVQQVALQNIDVDGNPDKSVYAVFDAVLISDIEYAAETNLQTVLVNDGKNTAVSSETLKSLGDYDIITVNYALTGTPSEAHKYYGVGAVANSADWSAILELKVNVTSLSFYVADVKAAINNGIVFNLWGIADEVSASVTSVKVQKCKSKLSTPIASVDSDVEVVSSEYYDLKGVKVSEMVKGINIVVEKLSDGTVRTTKVVKK